MLLFHEVIFTMYNAKVQYHCAIEIQQPPYESFQYTERLAIYNERQSTFRLFITFCKNIH